MDSFAPMLVLITGALVIGSIFRSFIVNRRLRDNARAWVDVQTKLIDKFGSADEVVRSLESDAGRRLIEGQTNGAGSPHAGSSTRPGRCYRRAMDDGLAATLRRLVETRSIAALGTLHDGAPFVSMVPFALAGDGSAFYIHVSGLAAHTRDMLADPRVSLLVVAAETPGTPPQALPRLTVVGTAEQLAADSPERSAVRAAYLQRFPDSAPMFDFGDFSLFAIHPASLRWVGGFAQAQTLTPATFAAAARSAP